MSEEGFSAAEERRSSSRFRRDPGWDMAVVRCPNGESIPAHVHDESLGGISLFLNDLCDLAVDQEVEITFASETLRSRVRHVQRQEGGGFILGFACSQAEQI